MTEPKPSPVIPLDRWVIALTRARRSQRLSEILNARDADARIAAAPAPELYFAMKEAGLHDSLPVLELCSPEQLQSFLDLGAWRGDSFERDDAAEWLGALLAASKPRFLAVIPRLDEEWELLFVRHFVEVFDSPDEVPDIPEEGYAIVSSPDMQSTFLVKDAQGQGALALAIIEAFYVLDPLQGRRFVEGLRAELDAQLEEEARRFRRGRLEDLGFFPREEAIALYAPPSPAQLRQQIAQRASLDAIDPEFLRFAGLPAPYLAPLENPGPLAELLGGASADQVPRVLAELPALMNRALSALSIDPADEAGIEAVARHVRAMLDRGVSALGGEAAALLPRASLRELFQLGWWEVLALQRRALALKAAPWVELLEDRRQQALHALQDKIPRYSLALATPPGEGARLFSSAEELRRATHAVEDAEAALALLGLLRLSHETLRQAQEQHRGAAPLEAGTLFATSIANALLGREFSPAPLARAELPALAARLFAAGEIALDVSERARDTLAALPQAQQDAAQRVMSQWLRRTLDELSRLSLTPLPEARFVGGILLRA